MKGIYSMTLLVSGPVFEIPTSTPPGTNLAPLIINALNSSTLQHGGTILLPPGRFSMLNTTPIVFTKPISIVGRGRLELPDWNMPATTLFRENSNNTTVFRWQPTGIHPSNVGCGGVSDLTFVEDRSSFPSNTQISSSQFVFDVVNAQGGVFFHNVGLFNVCRGIRFTNSGRSGCSFIYASPLLCGIQMDEMLDKSFLHNIHIWPFYSSLENPQGDLNLPTTGSEFARAAARYRQSACVGLSIGRADGLWMRDIFALGLLVGINFFTRPDGSRHVRLDTAYFDLTAVGINVSQSNARISVGSLTCQGEKYGKDAGDPPGKEISWGFPIRIAENVTSSWLSVESLAAERFFHGFGNISAGSQHNIISVGRMTGEFMNGRGDPVWDMFSVSNPVNTIYTNRPINAWSLGPGSARYATTGNVFVANPTLLTNPASFI